jgi:hypothetical protein
MRAVRASETFAATVAEAESCWCDVSRWEHWVEGLERVREVSDDWPATGARVVWESGPAGRGTVTERVLVHEPLRGLQLEVLDDSIRGRQTVTFDSAGDGVEVALALEYELLRRSIVSPVVDLLFIRRSMTDSLAATVARFGAELEAARDGRRP